MLSNQQRHNARQILFFGGVWLIGALIYTLIEFGLLGRLDYYPSTTNPYDFKNSILFTCLAGFLMGCGQGAIEVLWLRRAFRRQKLWVKIVFKSLFYLALIIAFIFLLAWVTNMRRFNTAPFDPDVLGSLMIFFSKFAFWSVVLYVGTVVVTALFIAEISQYLGSGMLMNFFFGRYHRPRRETRIFMFLDMNQSTHLAESLGHQAYFALLREYYATMTDPILESWGSIYHYVGDEIVVSWTEAQGLERANCLFCYRKIQEAFDRKAAHFKARFGLVPAFKAAFHIGEVTSGEIGVVKKDLIFTGDVLNTTARILGLCHPLNASVLASETLVEQLGPQPGIVTEAVGDKSLRGKEQEVALHRVTFTVAGS